MKRRFFLVTMSCLRASADATANPQTRAGTVLKAVIEKELARSSASLFGAFWGDKENNA